jgi:hypothetical protein
MLYKYLFSILGGHFNLNKKTKKNEFDRLPIKPTGKPVKSAGIPVRTGCTAKFEFKFEFHRYRPVFGQTGPVYRYRTAPVWPDRSVIKTLMVTYQRRNKNFRRAREHGANGRNPVAFRLHKFQFPANCVDVRGASGRH